MHQFRPNLEIYFHKIVFMFSCWVSPHTQRNIVISSINTAIWLCKWICCDKLGPKNAQLFIFSLHCLFYAVSFYAWVVSKLLTQLCAVLSIPEYAWPYPIKTLVSIISSSSHLPTCKKAVRSSDSIWRYGHVHWKWIKMKGTKLSHKMTKNIFMFFFL